MANSVPVETDKTEQALRELLPRQSNTTELLELMEQSPPTRQAWITEHNPTITEILKRYLRLQDMNAALSTAQCKMSLTLTYCLIYFS